jgi:hypothetical protein
MLYEHMIITISINKKSVAIARLTVTVGGGVGSARLLIINTSPAPVSK